jgi:hypothetical protein
LSPQFEKMSVRVSNKPNTYAAAIVSMELNVEDSSNSKNESVLNLDNDRQAAPLNQSFNRLSSIQPAVRPQRPVRLHQDQALNAIGIVFDPPKSSTPVPIDLSTTSSSVNSKNLTKMLADNDQSMVIGLNEMIVNRARVINKFLCDSRTYIRNLRIFFTELFLP